MIARIAVYVTLITSLFTSCTAVKPLEVKGITGFDVQKINNDGIEGDVRIRIHNPNPYSFSIYRGTFNVAYSGVKLGRAETDKNVKIAGKAENEYVFHISSLFSDITLGDIIRLLNASTRKELLEIDGEIHAGRLMLRKRFPVRFAEKVSLR